MRLLKPNSCISELQARVCEEAGSDCARDGRQNAFGTGKAARCVSDAKLMPRPFPFSMARKVCYY